MIVTPSFLTIASTIGTLITSIGGSLIGDKISNYLKSRFSIFQDEYSKTEGKDRIIILQKELLNLNNFKIEMLEEIINGDFSDEEEKKMLIELKDKTVFIKELEKLLK